MCNVCTSLLNWWWEAFVTLTVIFHKFYIALDNIIKSSTYTMYMISHLLLTTTCGYSSFELSIDLLLQNFILHSRDDAFTKGDRQ